MKWNIEQKWNNSIEVLKFKTDQSNTDTEICLRKG